MQSPTEIYDVVIVGASFAGLAVASQLKGYRVLLVDRKPVGSGQTSACGTVLKVIDHLDAGEAVLQTHQTIVLHTECKTHIIPSPYSWCTFDYQRLCEILYCRSGADFIQAAVTSFDGLSVSTQKGDFSARIFVDASGWRSVLASALQPEYPKTEGVNFGMETIIPLNGNRPPLDGLHFWYDSGVLSGGVGWVFPRGETVSLGLGKYARSAHLQVPLQQFTGRFDTLPESIHGTYFPYRLRQPTVQNLYVVGDAAGMCIGLTGEGIRPALFYGVACGQIIRRVLAGKIKLDTGLNEFGTLVEARRFFYQIFSGAQIILTRLPQRWIDRIVNLVTKKQVLQWVLDQYWNLTRDWEIELS